MLPREHVPLFWHGLVPHQSSIAQVTPLQPAGQEHTNELLPCEHVPPFWHGLLPHQSSFPHVTPLKP